MLRIVKCIMCSCRFMSFVVLMAGSTGAYSNDLRLFDNKSYLECSEVNILDERASDRIYMTVCEESKFELSPRIIDSILIEAPALPDDHLRCSKSNVYFSDCFHSVSMKVKNNAKKDFLEWINARVGEVIVLVLGRYVVIEIFIDSKFIDPVLNFSYPEFSGIRISEFKKEVSEKYHHVQVE